MVIVSIYIHDLQMFVRYLSVETCFQVLYLRSCGLMLSNFVFIGLVPETYISDRFLLVRGRFLSVYLQVVSHFCYVDIKDSVFCFISKLYMNCVSICPYLDVNPCTNLQISELLNSQAHCNVVCCPNTQSN